MSVSELNFERPYWVVQACPGRIQPPFPSSLFLAGPAGDTGPSSRASIPSYNCQRQRFGRACDMLL